MNSLARTLTKAAYPLVISLGALATPAQIEVAETKQAAESYRIQQGDNGASSSSRILT